MKKITEKGFVSFGQAIRDFFVGYIEFGGVSTRAGYWWAQLGLGIVYFVLFFWTMGAIFSQTYLPIGLFPVFLTIIFTLGMVVPSFALSVRRLRDTGIKSKAILVIYVFYFALTYTTIILTYTREINNLISTVNNLNGYDWIEVGTSVTPSFLLFVTCLFSVFLTAITLLPTDFFATESNNGFLTSIFKQKNRY